MTKKKIITALTSVLMLATLGFSMTGCSIPTDKSEHVANAPTQETVLAGGMEVGETQNHGIRLMSTIINENEYADYGIATYAEKAITISATIEPSAAANHGVDWSVAWTNPNGTWATGKDVTSYASLATGSTTKTVTVSCLQPFAAQITLTATSQDNPDITAKCTFEYAQKVTAATLNIGNIPVNFGGSTSVKYEVCPSVTGSGGVIAANITTNDVYTIAEAYTKTVTFKLDPDTEKWFHVKDHYPSNMKMNDSSVTNWLGKEYYFDYDHDIVNWAIFQRSEDILFKNLTTAEIIDYLSNITCPNICTITLTLTGAHNTYNYTSQLVCSGYTNSTPVKSLSVDTGNYVF